MPDSHKQRVLSLIRSKEIALIEDDIYGDLTFGLQRPRSIHSYDQEMGSSGLVLLCSSFSKSLSRDLRLGWILPGRYKDKVKRLKLVTQLASSQLTQQGVRMFLESGSYDRFLRKRRQQLAEQCQQLQDLLARLFPQATGCSKPLGESLSGWNCRNMWIPWRFTIRPVSGASLLPRAVCSLLSSVTRTVYESVLPSPGVRQESRRWKRSPSYSQANKNSRDVLHVAEGYCIMRAYYPCPPKDSCEIQFSGYTEEPL